MVFSPALCSPFPKSSFASSHLLKVLPQSNFKDILSLSLSQQWLGPLPAGEAESASPSFPKMWATGRNQSWLPHLPSPGFKAGNWSQSPHTPTSIAHVYFPLTHSKRTPRHLCPLPHLESTAPPRFSSMNVVVSPEFSSASVLEMDNLIFDCGYDFDGVSFFNV